MCVPYFPGGQGLHDVCPTWSWKVPLEQLAVVMPSLYFPGAEGMQESLDTNPGLLPTRPAGQALQPSSDGIPSELEYLPGGQFVQLFASEVYRSSAPLIVPCFPAAQNVHSVLF